MKFIFRQSPGPQPLHRKLRFRRWGVDAKFRFLQSIGLTEEGKGFQNDAGFAWLIPNGLCGRQLRFHHEVFNGSRIVRHS
jgi:hypothetical protein